MHERSSLRIAHRAMGAEAPTWYDVGHAYLVVERLRGLDRERTNVSGSGIALGHPVGCTGARIVVTLLHETVRRDEKVGMATLCGMGGVATARLIARE